jgi:hypothetical protein
LRKGEAKDWLLLCSFFILQPMVEKDWIGLTIVKLAWKRLFRVVNRHEIINPGDI